MINFSLYENAKREAVSLAESFIEDGLSVQGIEVGISVFVNEVREIAYEYEQDPDRLGAIVEVTMRNILNKKEVTYH